MFPKNIIITLKYSLVDGSAYLSIHDTEAKAIYRIQNLDATELEFLKKVLAGKQADINRESEERIIDILAEQLRKDNTEVIKLKEYSHYFSRKLYFVKKIFDINPIIETVSQEEIKPLTSGVKAPEEKTEVRKKKKDSTLTLGKDDDHQPATKKLKINLDPKERAMLINLADKAESKIEHTLSIPDEILAHNRVDLYGESPPSPTLLPTAEKELLFRTPAGGFFTENNHGGLTFTSRHIGAECRCDLSSSSDLTLSETKAETEEIKPGIPR